MKLILLALALLVGAAQIGDAQTFDAWPPAQRSIADYVSTGIVAGTIGADFVFELKQGHESGHLLAAAICNGVKYGAVNGAAIGLKALFPRERPNGLNNQDSFSEHTANVTVTGGPWWVDLVLGIVVGYFRGAANMHDVVGVLEGAGLGAVTRYGVTRIPACRGVS
jgi:hypothetical protein